MAEESRGRWSGGFALLLTVTALAGALGGCPRDGGSARQGGQVVPAQVVEQLAGWVRHQTAEMAGRPCLRPPLRGEVLEGPAAVDQLAVLAGSEDTRPCLDALRRMAAEDPNWLQALLPATRRQDRAALVRKWPLATLPGPDQKKLFAPLLDECRPLFARLHRAVSHGNACNPYRPGVRCEKETDARLLVAQAVAAGASRLFADGSQAEAFHLLLDAMRFEQDLLRGGATWSDVASTRSAFDVLVPVFEALLNGPDRLAPDLLAEVDGELGQLQDTQPHPVGLLLVEYLHLALAHFGPGLAGGPEASPTPGSACSLPPDSAPGADLSGLGVDERDRLALAWVAAERSFRESVLVCRPDRNARKCGQELARLHAKYKSVLEKDKQAYLRMQLRHLLPADRVASLQDSAARLLMELGPADGSDVARFGQIQFALAGLRTLAAFRAVLEKDGACPGLGAFQSGHLAEVRTNPHNGVPVDVLVLGPGSFGIAPTDPLAPGEGPEAQPSLRALCPSR